MSGNVGEWCHDRYGDYTLSAPPNPTGPESGSLRIERGGSWNSGELGCRVAFRGNDYPTDSNRSRGFRVARTETVSEAVPGMVLVEGGTFQMGNTRNDGEGNSDEKPVHTVNLTYDYWIGKCEVTFSEYDSYCEALGRSKPSDDGWGRGQRPVIWINWWEMINYCNWLSNEEGYARAYDQNGNLLDRSGNITPDITQVEGYRLPTEAEWEYAARGGHVDIQDGIEANDYKYAGSDDLNEVGWYDGNSGNKTQPVGQKKANELGLYDMSGNVYERCHDFYNETYYSAEAANTNPIGPTSGDFRIFRGGSWLRQASSCRVVLRGYYGNIEQPFQHLGFRLARTEPDEVEKYTLTVNVNNAGGKDIQELARNKIEVKLYKIVDGKQVYVSSHDCSYVDTKTVRATIAGLEKGTYGYEVYRKQDTSNGVQFGEYWGYGQTELTGNKAVTVVRNLPWISLLYPDSKIPAGTITPYVDMKSSQSGIKVRNTIYVSKTKNIGSPDYSSTSAEVTSDSSKTIRMNATQSMNFQEATYIYSKMECYMEHSKSWLVVDQYTWTKIEVVCNLTVNVFNIDNLDIHISARDDIYVKLLKNDQVIQNKRCGIISSKKVQVTFENLVPGYYSFLVYRKANESEYVYKDEIWGEASLSVNSNKTVDFTRMYPVIWSLSPVGAIAGGSITPSCKIKGGIQDMNVYVTFRFSKTKNYQSPDFTVTNSPITAKANVITDFIARNPVLFNTDTYVHATLENYYGNYRVLDTFSWEKIDIPN